MAKRKACVLVMYDRATNSRRAEYSRPIKRLVSGAYLQGDSRVSIATRSIEKRRPAECIQIQAVDEDVEYPPPAPHNTTGYIIDNLEDSMEASLLSPVPEWPWLNPQASFCEVL